MERFLDKLYLSHTIKSILPSQKLVEDYLESLLAILFPSYSNKVFSSKEKLVLELNKNQKDLSILLLHLESEMDKKAEEISALFYDQLAEVYELLLKDAKAIDDGDPAASSLEEVIRTYPGFYAVIIYRIAHLLYELGVPFIPRIFTELAHGKTGIDIHPGAKIGTSFFIDHGTGVVIGETTIIGNNVKLYQGVTLGALSVAKGMALTKRHPTIEDDVVIYAGATILGGQTIIGTNSIIGGNVWLTKSVQANSSVYHQPELRIKQPKTL